MAQLSYSRKGVARTIVVQEPASLRNLIKRGWKWLTT